MPEEGCLVNAICLTRVILPTMYVVQGKVMFSEVSVPLFTLGGGGG